MPRTEPSSPLTALLFRAVPLSRALAGGLAYKLTSSDLIGGVAYLVAVILAAFVVSDMIHTPDEEPSEP